MIIITGGLGYIGKNIAFHLLLKGEKVYLIDNFSNSSIESLHKLRKLCDRHNIDKDHILFHCIDISNKDFASRWFDVNLNIKNKIKAIIHCAGYKSVNDSISSPEIYYRNNICSTLNIIDLVKMLNESYKSLNMPLVPIIFSSSVTVYGNVSGSIDESLKCDLQSITNPYGKTKFIIEEILKDISSNVSSICLRYFNPIGCYDTLDEEITNKSTNIIPSLIKSISNNCEFNIFGNDYNTRDGTCVREYIDVRDLAEAHYLALKYVQTINFDIINLGTKNGTSVKELIDTFNKVKNINIKYKVVGRREGDSASSTCKSDKAYDLLGWKPNYKLEESINSISLK